MVFGIPSPPGESGQTQKRVAETPVKKFNTFKMGWRRAFFMPMGCLYVFRRSIKKRNKPNRGTAKENSFITETRKRGEGKAKKKPFHRRGAEPQRKQKEYAESGEWQRKTVSPRRHGIAEKAKQRKNLFTAEAQSRRESKKNMPNPGNGKGKQFHHGDTETRRRQSKEITFSPQRRRAAEKAKRICRIRGKAKENSFTTETRNRGEGKAKKKPFHRRGAEPQRKQNKVLQEFLGMKNDFPKS
jgi:hypothetical protein